MSYYNVGDDTAEIGIKICDFSKQNKGYGKILLSMFIRSLFSNYGYKKIILDTNLNNTRAQHVYEKLGFKKVRVKNNSWKNQIGELQSSVDYELVEENFNDFTKINAGGEMDTYNADFWSALDELVGRSKIVIDRPKGTVHPKFSHFIYKVDYGYLENTSSMDGAGIDVWVGTEESKSIDAIMCTVDLMKKDSEIKILIGCTEEEKEIVYKTHNETQYMKGILIRRNI